MKNLILLAGLLVCLIAFTGCNKEDEKNYNTLEITTGEFSGYQHTFSPNMGFWSPVSGSVWQVHLVLGDDNNQATAAENVMSVLFYRTGNPTVRFPSAEGQWANFGINLDGSVHYFGAKDATLTIYYLDETRFDGNLAGEFVNLNNAGETMQFSMNINLMMQEI